MLKKQNFSGHGISNHLILFLIIICRVRDCAKYLESNNKVPYLAKSLLCSKPKNPEEEVALDGPRPLLLLEVIRKLWKGIIVERISRAWDRHRVLATSFDSSTRGNIQKGPGPHSTPPASTLGHGAGLDKSGCPPTGGEMASRYGRGGSHGYTHSLGPPNMVAKPVQGLPDHPLHRRPKHLPTGLRHTTEGRHQPIQLDQLL